FGVSTVFGGGPRIQNGRICHLSGQIVSWNINCSTSD
ncbi:MAG: hypothetical protein ACI8S6_000242, partial [Myxococcota bacterium]